jgi:hypothetical protein
MPSSTGDPLVTFAIQSAIQAYRAEKNDNLKGRAYVMGLIEAAASLSDLTVQGIKDEMVITWEPFLEPMFSWMVRNNILTIRTSKNPKAGDSLAAKRAVLVHILSAQDMVNMKLTNLA